jgi:hypothetical protein
MDPSFHAKNGRAHSLSFILILMLCFIIGLGILGGYITP